MLAEWSSSPRLQRWRRGPLGTPLTDKTSARESTDNGRDGLRCACEALGAKTDARLVMDMISADAEALAEAYDRYAHVVYGLGLRLCGQQEAESMTREVFQALWRSPADFVRPSESLRATLIGEMHRRAAMFLQSQHGRRDGATFGPAVGEVEHPSPDESTGQAQHRSPSNLTDDRDAVHLAYFGGYTYKQIAALLGRPTAMVAADLHAQLRRLSTQIS